MYDRLLEVLRENPRVRLVHAFGSAAREAAGPLSDVDIGVLLDARPTWDEERELRASRPSSRSRASLASSTSSPFGGSSRRTCGPVWRSAVVLRVEALRERLAKLEEGAEILSWLDRREA